MILFSKIMVIANVPILLMDVISWAIGRPPTLTGIAGASWPIKIALDYMSIWACSMNCGWLPTDARRINGECE